MATFDHDYLAATEIQTKEAVGLVVIDLHPVMRFGICRLIEAESEFKVLGDASDRQTGLQLVKVKRPDILLLDVEQDAPLSTCEFITDVLQEAPQTKILVYTANCTECRALEALRRGVSGYLIKTSQPERLFEAIRVVAGGGSYLDPRVASLVIGRVGRLHDRRAPNGRDLTPREKDVLSSLVSGKRNREIATELFISERTVKFHIKSMFYKLKAKTRTEVVKIAINKGFV